VIAYSVDNDAVVVIGVFYGGRDFEALLGGPSMSSDSLTRAQILSQLGAAMLARGWSLHSFSGLPKVFAKTELVTPFYGIPEIRPFKDDWYGLGGHVGVIHQEFEEIWTARDENRGKQNLFPVVLLIANLKPLLEIAYVHADTLAEDMERLVAAVAEVLSKMPHSEVELKAVFEKGQLCGRPINDFSGWAQRPKFAEFRQFVEGLP
jgi:hypothetical protein